MKRVLNNSILDRLNTRLSLQSLSGDGGEAFVLHKQIHLTSDVTSLLQQVKIVRSTGTVSSTGILYLATVPPGKRWSSVAALRPGRLGGGWTWDCIWLYSSYSSLAFCYLELATPTSGGVTHEPLGLSLDTGDRVGINVNSYTSGGDAECLLWVTEELTY